MLHVQPEKDQFRYNKTPTKPFTNFGFDVVPLKERQATIDESNSPFTKPRFSNSNLLMVPTRPPERMVEEVVEEELMIEIDGGEESPLLIQSDQPDILVDTNQGFGRRTSATIHTDV